MPDASLNFRYSHASREARQLGVRLLELTQVYEDFHSADRTALSIAGLVGRGRRLLRSAYVLADVGRGLEAAVLLRSLTEYCFMLLWLNLDIELNLVRWLYDGLTRLLDQDAELRAIARRLRSEANLPAPGPGDEPLGLLLPEMRRRMIAARNARREELAGIADLDNRVEPARDGDDRTALERAKHLPSIRTQARLGGLGDHYALGYTFDSLAIAHPNSMAAEQLLSLAQGSAGAAVVRPSAVHSLPDPYAVGAALLGLLAHAGGEVIPELAVDEIISIQEELQALRPFAAATGA